MEGWRRRRRLAYGLRAAGLALMLVSLCAALLHSGAGAALAQVMPVPGLGTPIPDTPPTASPAPAPPSPTPAPLPMPIRQLGMVRGGPLTFSLTGSLSLGERSSSSTRGDDSSPGGMVTVAQSQQTNNAGLMVQLQRRTGATTLTMGMPLGVSSSQRTTLGQLQAGYYTSHYGLQFMPQPVSELGVVPIGSTLAGLSLVLPLRGGDVSLYEGNALVNSNGMARIYGMRARSLFGRNLYELGFVRADGQDGIGRIDSAIAGFASANGALNQIFEGVVQRHENDSEKKTADALQYRLDYGNDTVYSTIAVKHITDGFTSIGSGTISADDQLAAAFRSGAVSVQETFDSTVVSGDATRSRQGAVSVFQQFGRTNPVTTMWTLSDQRSQNLYGATWLGSAGMQVGTSFRDLSALFQVQASRSTSNLAAPLGAIIYQAMLQKPIGSYVAQLQYQKTRQTSDDTFSKIAQTNIAVSREWGVTALTLSDTLTHTQTLTSDALQSAPLLTLSRRLSPALSLGVSYGMQITHDALNPTANGRSRLFSIQFTAPFAIGNGLVQGRANPRLPATITGTVINDVGNQGPFTAAVSNGVGNVMVVLDGDQVQRTDLSGRFQFNFVTPGHHTVQLDLASLPRGVTPDQPIAGIDVQGGQEGQVFFRIGTYGAIQGHVYGRDPSGQLVPLQGVVLSVDTTGGVATTGADGLYGFGRLSSGAHVVAVQTASLPAMASLPADTISQKVSVRSGAISTLDFTAKPLGSIAGFVVYDPSLAPTMKGGVMNAYVVAEPGDYAAITNDDGSFLLDNLPAGTYSLDLDPETVPKDTGNVSGAQSITLEAGAHVEGVHFVVGTVQKAVIFTLKSTDASMADVSLQEQVLPPGGATEITVAADGHAKSVTVKAFGKTFDLLFDRERKKWVGMIDVPLAASAGTITVEAQIKAPHATTASADLKVDPALALARFTMNPARPARGQYVTVHARFLADVHPGDQIHWIDGQSTKLTHPITGRVYEFTVKISEQPLRGRLLTEQGEVPILLR
jgi:hypothetical protein